MYTIYHKYICIFHKIHVLGFICRPLLDPALVPDAVITSYYKYHDAIYRRLIAAASIRAAFCARHSAIPYSYSLACIAPVRLVRNDAAPNNLFRERIRPVVSRYGRLAESVASQ